MAEKRSTSIQYINTLRVLAIYAVILGHVAIWTTYDMKPLGVEWWVSTWVHLLCLCSIPVFVMVSGALLLDDSGNESPGAFYKKRMLRVGIPLLFWAPFFLAVRVFLDKEEMSVGRAAELILTADPYYHLWFLCMIPALYLVTPVLRVFIRHSSPGQRILLMVIMFSLAGIYSPINTLLLGNKRTIFTMFIPYVAYYIAGYEIRFADPKKVPRKYLVWAAGACAVYIGVVAYPFIDALGEAKTQYPGGTPQFVYDSFCLPQVVMGIGFFWAVYIIHQRIGDVKGVVTKLIGLIATTTLGIYILHPLVLAAMRANFADESSEGGLLFTLTAGPMFAFVATWLLTSLLMNIPYFRRTIS
ncbi:MAG: acyltransferase family protein [Sedimentisphaerales bacterium]|nr:acyltransferase family protein [Sedimentisphaerales bacterium]